MAARRSHSSQQAWVSSVWSSAHQVIYLQDPAGGFRRAVALGHWFQDRYVDLILACVLKVSEIKRTSVHLHQHVYGRLRGSSLGKGVRCPNPLLPSVWSRRLGSLLRRPSEDVDT